MVIAPASTGSDKRRRITVIVTAQINRGIRSNKRPLYRMFNTVVIKFKAPRIDEAPAMWREKMARSTVGPAWEIFLAKGG